MTDPWLTLEEAAAYLKVSKPTIYRFCAEGCLPFYKLAGTGQRRFKHADLEALLVRGEPSGRPTPSVDDAAKADRPHAGATAH